MTEYNADIDVDCVDVQSDQGQQSTGPEGTFWHGKVKNQFYTKKMGDSE